MSRSHVHEAVSAGLADCAFRRGSELDRSAIDAQTQLDVWVEHCNSVRPHRGIGMVTSARRFALADSTVLEPVDATGHRSRDVTSPE